MKIAALCDRDTAIALRMGGIHEVHVPDNNAEKTWNQLSDRDDIGILFVTEKIADTVGKKMREYRLRNTFPLILEIPDKKGRKEDHIDYISHLTKRAVGIDVSKQQKR